MRGTLRSVGSKMLHSRAGLRTSRALQRIEITAVAHTAIPGYRLPDFLGIGGPQSGTTWLAENLRRQPGAFVSSRKELEYWNRHFELPLLWYSRWFRSAGNRVAGEITPGYAFLPTERISLMARVIPQVRLVYIARNPIDREFAAARRFFGRRLQKDLATVPVDDWLDYLRTAAPNPRSEHAANLDRWRSVFGSEQLLVLFYEDLESDPVATLQRVCVHLGVSCCDTSAARAVVNANPAIAMPDAVRDFLSRAYAPAMDELSYEFPAQVARWG